MKAVILAGGRGTRLHPYTTHFPKPLMPVGGMPVLEIIVTQLRKAGFGDIILTTGHMEEMFRLFFKDGKKYGVTITYSTEDQPLGTAGPLNLIKEQLDNTFLLMNGDVLADINFEELIRFHKENKAAATVVLKRRKVFVDFGIVEITDPCCFSAWKEKPNIEYLVSTGIYLFEAEALDSLPSCGFFNLPDFITKLHKDRKKVAVYIHRGYWLDIGRPDDYERACLDFENNKIKC